MAGLYTRTLPLVYDVWQCRGGPCDGQKLVLTEHDGATAWLEWAGEVGRYESNNHGVLIWRRQDRDGPASR